MATSSSQRNGKTLDPKVSILIFQVVQGDAIQAMTPSVRYMRNLHTDFDVLLQTIKRLAQNREAARKSRLRKKVSDSKTEPFQRCVCHVLDS
jgi:hypothetical protein